MPYTLCNTENIILQAQYHKLQTETFLAAHKTNYLLFYISTDELEKKSKKIF